MNVWVELKNVTKPCRDVQVGFSSIRQRVNFSDSTWFSRRY